MPDTPVDRPDPASYDPRHEARISRLEDGLLEVKSTLGQMLPMLVRIDSMLSTTLPHLATKAEPQELRTEFVNGRAETALEFSKVREEATVQSVRFRDEMAARFAETRIELSRVETQTNARFDAMAAAIAAVQTEVTVICTDVAHLATKAELAEKSSKAYLGGVLAPLVATFGAGMAGLAILLQ